MGFNPDLKCRENLGLALHKYLWWMLNIVTSVGTHFLCSRIGIVNQLQCISRVPFKGTGLTKKNLNNLDPHIKSCIPHAFLGSSENNDAFFPAMNPDWNSSSLIWTASSDTIFKNSYSFGWQGFTMLHYHLQEYMPYFIMEPELNYLFLKWPGSTINYKNINNELEFIQEWYVMSAFQWLTLNTFYKFGN